MNDNRDLNEENEKLNKEEQEQELQNEDKQKEPQEEKEEEKEIYNELEERKKELKAGLKRGMRGAQNQEPDNDGDKKPAKEPKFSFKTIVMLLFLVTLILSMPNFFSKSNAYKANEVSYSEFLNMLKEGEFTGVEEKDGYLYADRQSDNKKISARMITNRISEDNNVMQVVAEKNLEVRSSADSEVPLLVSVLISWFPMLLLIGVWIFMLNKMNKGSSGGPQIFNMGKSRAKENGDQISNVTFKDVAGIEEAKEELEEVVNFLKEPEKYRRIGARIPKGVLLLGDPGTGKTLLAKAVAGEAGVPFFSISGSEFVEMFVGVGASRVRDLFNKARKSSPCIIFIDEIDAVGRKRGAGQGGGNDEREQTLNQLLVEMDGFGTDETIIVLAATNRPEILDRALMRPGRFDRQVVVDRPDINGRLEILKVHIRGKKVANDVDLNTVARKTVGFVGADLANLLNEAAILAAREGREEIAMEDLEEAAEKVTIGPERKSRVTVQKERLTVAYHEVGHAIVQWVLPNTEAVHKVTIVPRGMAALGYTMSLPAEDRYLKMKSEYLSELRTLLGGRAAEEIIFGDITTGASNDIERATKIAHVMVTKFGMSEKFGPLLLDDSHEGDIFRQKIHSEETGKEIDDEVRQMINDAYQDAIGLLSDNRDKLDYITKVLLERETITGEELDKLMKGEELEEFKKAAKTGVKIEEEIKENIEKTGIPPIPSNENQPSKEEDEKEEEEKA